VKTLYYLRHGESEFNRGGRWSGQGNPQLTPVGISQAKQAGFDAKQAGIRFDVIYSSPLDRARQTAELFCQEIDFPIKEIKLDKQLIERSYGKLEGTRNIIAAAKYARSETGIDHYPEVERLKDLQARAQRVLENLQGDPAKVILVVGHGAFYRALWREVNQRPLGDRGHYLHNATLVKLI
jgi:broad specificity phosphatase PhoE